MIEVLKDLLLCHAAEELLTQQMRGAAEK